MNDETELEQLRALAQDANAAQDSDPWFFEVGANIWNERYTAAQRRMQHYQALREELIAKCPEIERREAGWLWEKLDKYDVAQRIRIFAGLLRNKGWITNEDFVESRQQWTYVDPQTVERQKALQSQWDEDTQVLEAVFKAVGPDPNRREEARRVYNALGDDRPRSAEKNERFVWELVQHKLLGPEYLPGAKFGNFFNKLIRHPEKQDKMRRLSREDK